MTIGGIILKIEDSKSNLQNGNENRTISFKLSKVKPSKPDVESSKVPVFLIDHDKSTPVKANHLAGTKTINDNTQFFVGHHEVDNATTSMDNTQVTLSSPQNTNKAYSKINVNQTSMTTDLSVNDYQNDKRSFVESKPRYSYEEPKNRHSVYMETFLGLLGFGNRN